MNDLILRWSKKDITPQEYMPLLEQIPGMTDAELRFIFSNRIADSVRESAREELIAREAVRPRWERYIALIALLLGVILTLIQIGEWISKL